MYENQKNKRKNENGGRTKINMNKTTKSLPVKFEKRRPKCSNKKDNGGRTKMEEEEARRTLEGEESRRKLNLI